MQFDPDRAFPYPVLRRHVDDYVNGDIQVLVEFSPQLDTQALSVDVDFMVSVPEIRALVSDGLARYTTIFACRDTYFRLTVGSDSPRFHQEFPVGALRGEVIASSFVAAIKPIRDFQCRWINPEFGTGPFNFEEGAVIALDPPQQVYIDKDLFKPISSIFVLVVDEAVEDHQWRIKTAGDKVRIEVGKALKEKIDIARNDRANRAVLINSIYFSAAVQCVSYLRHSDDYEGERWAQLISQKIANEGLDLKSTDEYLLVEKLMKNPFRHVETYVFAGGEK